MAETATVEIPEQAPPPAETPPQAKWYDGLSEEVRRDERFTEFSKKYNTLDDAVRGHFEALKLVGRKTEGMVKVPTANATPEETQAFRKAIGVPEAADKYTFEIADDLAAYVPEDARQRWAAFFHKEGVPSGMAQKLIAAYAQDAEAQKIALHQSMVNDLASLKEQMGGPTFDRYMAMAKSGVDYVVSSLGDEDGKAFKAMLDDTLMGDHRLLIKAFSLIGRTLAEDGHVPVEGVGGGQLDAAKEYILASFKPDHPAMKPDDPQNQAALDRRREAFQLVTQFDPNWRPYSEP